ncbi:type II toxin-antitoxin system RelE/ParE family toxin [Pectobacterium brasiliense]|uniref:type II toxin-antitoxin system RelE family toxin n=1 Tax=Pectobacterium TaxID=122277 RepID=UPI00196974A9|nr:type II toxin-antitoxin system RelE/ParE family toxin [Pectobacterium brasiliense]MBN3100177.1 type II toxin-antitoxin system RelE/ParE family toxin [Pectobacterium brasiliense]MBN3167259.1 type II toxin-antitoxin system RelE/ParE family toxin [Pectobacterium brasiliense]
MNPPFAKKLKEVLQNPHVPANRLQGMADCYKIKLRSAGYRLVYQVLEHEIVVLVLAVGKRERSAVYKAAKDRL